MPEPSLLAARRLRRMYDRLLKAYGPQHWWPARTKFEVVVGAYLTQNTSWKGVEKSLGQLRAARALSITGLRRLDPQILEHLIRPSGFATQKARALKAFIALLDAHYGGSLTRMSRTPAAEMRIALLALPGVGLETADAILLYAFGHAVPVADEYLRRIAERHALLSPVPGRNRRGYIAVAELMRRTFSATPTGALTQIYNEMHALVVAVGKKHCSRSPKCEGCPLAYDLAQSEKKAPRID